MIQMSKVAIDIVILPPESIMQVIIDLIDYTNSSVIKLNLHDCLPHVSLAMCAVDTNDIPKINSLLDRLAELNNPFSLNVKELKTTDISNGKSISEASIVANDELTALHTSVMNILQPFVIDLDVTTDMFYSPPTTAPISTTWVQHYLDSVDPDSYRPHITLGEGAISQPKTSIQFAAKRIALCHLGSYCTCRKIIYETSLKQTDARR